MAYVKKGLGPSLQRNYDKIIFAISVVFLIVSAVYLLNAGGRIGTESEEFQSQVDRLSPGHPTLAAADTNAVVSASAQFHEPFQLGTNKLFLVAQERVRCINVACRHPIPFDAKECSFCGTPQPAEGQVTGGDSDNDGMPDEFEAKFAFLNPVDAADADADYDNDGFTNLEEYEAQTDPSNPASHPSKIEFLRVSGVEEDTIAFRLNGTMRMSAEKVFYQIKAPSRDWNVLPGQEFEDPRIPGGKYKIVDVGVVTNMVAKQGYTEKRPVELPVVVISNGLSKYRLIGDGTPGSSGEFRVTFICTKDMDRKEYLGLPGQPFSFDGADFIVFQVDRKHGSVLIHRVSDNKEFDVPKQ